MHNTDWHLTNYYRSLSSFQTYFIISHTQVHLNIPQSISLLKYWHFFQVFTTDQFLPWKLCNRTLQDVYAGREICIHLQMGNVFPAFYHEVFISVLMLWARALETDSSWKIPGRMDLNQTDNSSRLKYLREIIWFWLSQAALQQTGFTTCLVPFLLPSWAPRQPNKRQVSRLQMLQPMSQNNNNRELWGSRKPKTTSFFPALWHELCGNNSQ